MAKAPTSDRFSFVRGWRKDAIAGSVAALALGAVVANAAFMQSGPHPAPLFSNKPATVAAPKSVRVVGEEFTGPVSQASLPRSRPIEAGAPAIQVAKSDPLKVEMGASEAPGAQRPRNEVVADIQRELGRRGFYDGAPDGLFGPKTSAAMRDFEQASGLRPGSEPNDVFLRAVMRSQAKAGQSRVAVGQPAPSDPIAELIAPSSKRIFAVQRALTDYGYGQFRPSGTFGPETRDAIEQFERARSLPVTGQISPRLVRELAAVTGRELD